MKTEEVNNIRITAYYDGMENGIREYAWWKDGTQYVGTTGGTLAEAIAEVHSHKHEALETLKRKDNGS